MEGARANGPERPWLILNVRQIKMSAPREKSPRPLKEVFARILYPCMGLGVVALFAFSLRRSGWTFRGWLSDVVGIVWGLAFFCGLLLLLAAHASKETNDIEEAYRFMRLAALTFLTSAFTLWLVFRGYV